MAGYGLRELNTARETKANPYVCGLCGGQVPKHEELCQSCKDDLFFNIAIDQIEMERG